MFKLKKLTINNFGSFKQIQSIDFPQSGLLLLHGENGSGKSSLLKAIAYCLDFLDEPASDFINWDNQEDIFVQLVLSYKDMDLTIQRGNGLYKLEYGAIKTSGADTPKKIKELIVDPQFMSIMSYRGQGQEGNFSKLKPGEKQEFLSQLQSLNDFETVIEKTEASIEKLEQDVLDNKKDYDNLFSSAQYIVESVDRDNQLKDKLDSEIQTNINKLANFQLDVSEFNSKLNILMDTKNSLQPDTSLDAQITELEKEVLKYGLLLNDLSTEERTVLKQQNELLKESYSLRNQINDIEKVEYQIQQIKNKTCPTCKQGWHNSASELNNLYIKLADLKSKKNTLDQIDLDNQDILDHLREIRRKIDENKQTGIEFLNQQEELERQKRNNNSKFQIIDKEIENVNLQKKQAIKVFELQKQSLESQIQQLEKTRSQYLNNIELNTNKINQIDIKLQDNKTKEAAYLIKINEEKEVLNASKDFLRLITEDTLKLISIESSKYIHELPNAKNFFIQFDTSKTNKNGKLKKEITLQIFKNGKEVPFKRLSGGEKSSVHLAIDLAVSKILSGRTGKNLGWFILDESLDGMRINNKIEALNMLKTLSKDKLIIIVDHTSEIGEVFDKVLHVIKKDSGSTVRFISKDA